MNLKIFLECTAAGLRQMQHKPDALLYISGFYHDFEPDEFKYLGFPLLKTYIPHNTGYDGDSFPVYPCFTDLNEYKIARDIHFFQQSFKEKLIELS